MSPGAQDIFPNEERPVVTVARNVSTRCLAIVVDALIGLLMLPFNVSHLGASAYGLWMLTASVTVHFSVLNLGYSGALVKFVALYRAHRSVKALNEIASTLFFVFTAAGCVAYAIAAVLAFNLDSIFRLTPEQAAVGKVLLLVIGVQVALNFPFSIYGGIVSGFQRNHTNSAIAIVSSLAVAAVNVAVLTAGYGLVPLVIATTAVRVATYFVYRRSALRTYPLLEIRPSLFRRGRLREVTGFSVYSLVIDWANKLNYQCDTIVIGAFLGAAPIAVWTVANRIILATQMLSNQVNAVLFPLVVDSDASQRPERLRQILLQGTRLSLVMVLPVAAFLTAMSEPLIRAWVGTEMLGSVPVLQVLAIAVGIRVGSGTATTILKGAGRHRMLAWNNFITGIANVVLSIVLIGALGLVGVALGTLIAISVSSAVTYPAACRRVGVPLHSAIWRAIVPALWPAIAVGLLLAVTRDTASGTLLALLIRAALAEGLYLVLFIFVAMDGQDRAAYLTKARELLGRDAATTVTRPSRSAAV